MELLGSHWTDFDEILYLKIIRKSVEKKQVWLKYDENNVSFAWIPMYIYDSSSSSS